MLKGIGIAFGLLAVGLIGFSYSGVYDVSARVPHSAVTEWLLSNTSHQSVKRRAEQVVLPDLSNENLVLIGAGDFDAMCVGCHGAPGVERSALGEGLSPPAPDLTDSAAHMSASELFWVTKNGIRMTGMPAWGVSHNDSELWPLVAFMLKLPDLAEPGYQELLARGRHMSHHTQSSNISRGDSQPDDSPQEAEQADNHDSHDHEH